MQKNGLAVVSSSCEGKTITTSIQDQRKQQIQEILLDSLVKLIETLHKDESDSEFVSVKCLFY